MLKIPFHLLCPRIISFPFPTFSATKPKLQEANLPNPKSNSPNQNNEQTNIVYTFCLTIGLLCSSLFSMNSETSFTILTCEDRRSSQISSNLYTGVTLSSSDVAASIIRDLQYDSTALRLESIFPKFANKTLTSANHKHQTDRVQFKGRRIVKKP